MRGRERGRGRRGEKKIEGVRLTEGAGERDRPSAQVTQVDRESELRIGGPVGVFPG